MSMNLHCNLLDLRQTPTDITYMCMTDSLGLHYELSGDDAIAALNRYIQWVDGSLDGVWEGTIEELRDAQASNNYHIDEVREIIENNEEDIKVYVL